MKPKNVVKLKDEDRIITIYKDSEYNFLIHIEDINNMREDIFEVNLETFLKLSKAMRSMKDFCIATDKGIISKILKMKKSEIKTFKA